VSLRAAIVGCGSAGTRRAYALRALGIDDITVTDRHAERARNLAAAVGGATVGSVARAAAGCDAVLVCTPAECRALFALAAVRQGAHVFIEAPLSDRIEEVRPLLEGSTASGRVLMVGSRCRFHPGLARIRALIEARTLGRVYAASMWLGTALAGRARPQDGDGGTVTESRRCSLVESAQWFDTLLWLFGKPVEVTAMCGSASPRATDGEGAHAALVRMGNGAVVQVHTDAFRGPEASRIDVVGTDGVLHWSADDDRIVLHRLGGRERREEHVPAREDEVDRAELRHFFACVLSGRSPEADGREGSASLALMLAVRRAARIRRALALGDDLGRFGRRRCVSTVLRLVHAS
jgi:predicted dehydrogenase